MNTKQLIYIVIIVLVLLGIAWALSEAGKRANQVDTERPVEEGEALSGTATYAVDPALTEVEWTGTRSLVVDYDHTGTLTVATGSVSVVDGAVTGGSVVFDMTSITTTEDGAGARAGGTQLDNHLKSADFFDVAKYPISTFTLTSVEAGAEEGAYTVTGNLTLKGKTNPVTFPARIYAREDGALVVDADMKLDRTLWDVRFGSGKFFQNIGDNAIDDEFALNVHLVGRAQ